MRECNRQMGVEQANRRIKLKERKGEDGCGSHPVRQQPEEKVLVAHEGIPGKRIGSRQGHQDRNHGVHGHVDDGVYVAPVPGRIGEDLDIVCQCPSLREQREPGKDFIGCLETHRDEPVDRQHQEEDVNHGNQAFQTHDGSPQDLLSFIVISV